MQERHSFQQKTPAIAGATGVRNRGGLPLRKPKLPERRPQAPDRLAIGLPIVLLDFELDLQLLYPGSPLRHSIGTNTAASVPRRETTWGPSLWQAFSNTLKRAFSCCTGQTASTHSCLTGYLTSLNVMGRSPVRV